VEQRQGGRVPVHVPPPGFSGRLDQAPVAGLPESEEGFPDFRKNRPRDGALGLLTVGVPSCPQT